MIIKKIKQRFFAKQTPGFIAFTIPVFCLIFIVLFKNMIMILQVQSHQYHYLEDKKKLDKVKQGILQYFKDKQHLPELNSNNELDYETYISYYIPSIYRYDRHHKDFKVILHDLKYKHPEQRPINRTNHEDIYVICTIQDEKNDIHTAIYANEIELLLEQDRSDIRIIKKDNMKSQELDLKSIARMLNTK